MHLDSSKNLIMFDNKDLNNISSFVSKNNKNNISINDIKYLTNRSRSFGRIAYLISKNSNTSNIIQLQPSLASELDLILSNTNLSIVSQESSSFADCDFAHIELSSALLKEYTQEHIFKEYDVVLIEIYPNLRNL